MEILTEKVANELLSITKKWLIKICEKKKWMSFFDENVSFLTNNKNTDFYNEQLFHLFDDDVIKKLSSLMIKNNGFTYYQIVEKELNKIVLVWDIDEDSKRCFINKFIENLTAYLKENYPNYYEQYVIVKTFEVTKENQSALTEIRNDLLDLKESVSDFRNVLDLNSLNWMLINSSDKRVDLTFFESDDTDFISKFYSEIGKKGNVYVYSNSRFEALFTVLCELKKCGQNALIVRDEKDWILMSKKKNISGKVLIPFFMADFITAIPNNTNIFIYDNEYDCSRDDKIEVKRRRYKTILDRLVFFDYSHEEAHDLLEKTHGFFQPIFKRIFNKSIFNTKYSIEQADLDVIICGLLLGQWKNTKGDIAIIEILSNMKYESFISIIEKYTIGDNPIFFRYTIYGETKYLVVSLEDALIQFMSFIKQSIWESYIELIEFILFDVDNKYKNVYDDTTSFFVKNNFSDNLKEGVCKSLLFVKYSSPNQSICNLIDNKIRLSLDKVSSIEEWANISKYSTYICELSPEVFLEKIDKDLSLNNSIFLQLFQLKNDAIWGNNYYINYLWSLELLLSTSKYVYKALDILFKLNDYDFSYNMSNSPKNSLNYVFCSWLNLSCIRNTEKVRVLEKYIKINENNIQFALDNLPFKNNSIFGGLYSPKYLMSESEKEDIYNKDVLEVCEGYFELCLSNMKSNYKVIMELISDVSFFSTDKIRLFFDRLCDVIDGFDDSEKYEIAFKIRDEVYKHKYHCSAEWALNDDIGNTSNYGIGISCGIISVPEVNIIYNEISRKVIQADIDIASGNSGGALLDKKGRLIGITTFRTKDLSNTVNYGFAYSIPVRIVKEYIGE